MKNAIPHLRCVILTGAAWSCMDAAPASAAPAVPAERAEKPWNVVGHIALENVEKHSHR